MLELPISCWLHYTCVYIACNVLSCWNVYVCVCVYAYHLYVVLSCEKCQEVLLKIYFDRFSVGNTECVFYMLG